MAEPNSTSSERPPKLISLSRGASGTPPAERSRPAEPKPTVPRGWLTAAIGLLLLCLLGLAVQTQRVAARDAQIGQLSSRVEGLEARLSTANARLAAYDTQLGRIRSSVALLMEQLGELAEIVEAEPAAPAAPPAERP